jgi:endonuclease YncB( thermonuclease family)/DNA/RNA endonuclease YhcR with UshA esterase domain
MKITIKLLSVLLLACMLVGSFVACNKTPDDPEHVDYAASVKLDMSSSSLKQEVTVKMFIDGDTTHFYVPNSVIDGGVLKARYLAVDTPESTGKIEAWGKTASNFTKEKLSSATSIIVESDDGKWNADSTGSRYLVWVWYKPEGSDEYRNLNIEILQNGLAIASNSGQNRYGETCLKAIAQAESEKLSVHSGTKDPNFYYGEAVELTLKELRCNIADYDGVRVAFNGIVTKDSNNGVYVESYDEETEMYYGIYVYYGASASGDILDMLIPGNEVRIVGNVTEFQGSYQVSGLTYRKMKPNDPNNTQKLSEGHSAAYLLTSADRFKNGKVDVIMGDEKKTFDYAELALGSSIKLENLKVKSMYTTDDENSGSRGAISITCEVDGVTIVIRTAVLYDNDNKIITESYFEGKTINVKGFVDCFNGQYQVKLLSIKDVDIKN